MVEQMCLGVSDDGSRGSAAGWKTRSIAGNLAASYCVSLMDIPFSVICNIFLPYYASRSAFAFYRLLVLYAGYAGLLHCGLLNGFYIATLDTSGRGQQGELARRIRRFLLVQQAVATPLGLIALRMMAGVGSGTLMFGVGCAWNLLNVATLYNYRYQGSNDFRTYARINVIGKGLGICVLLVFVLFNRMSEMDLVVAYIVPIFATVCLYTAEFGREHRSEARHTPVGGVGIWHAWRRGLQVYVANAALALYFSMGALLISIAYSKEVFAAYSVAAGLSALTYMLMDGLTAAATPLLGCGRVVQRAERNRILTVYRIYIYLCPLLYWPCLFILKGMLSKYVGARSLLVVLFAGIPFAVIIRSRLLARCLGAGCERALLCFSLLGLSGGLACVGAAHVGWHSFNAVAVGWVISTAMLAGVWAAANRLGVIKGAQGIESVMVCDATVASILFVALTHFDIGNTGAFVHVCISALVLYVVLRSMPPSLEQA